MSAGKKAVRRLLWSFVLLVAIVGGGAVFFLATETGAVQIVKLLNQSVPGLQMSGARGQLYKNIRLESLVFSSPTMNLVFENVALQWSLERIWRRHLIIDDATIERVTITPLGEKDESAAPFQPVLPNIPVSVDVRQFSIATVLVANSDEPFNIADINLVGNWSNDGIDLGRLSFFYEEFAIRSTALVNQTDTLQLRGEISVLGTYKAKELSAEAKFFGPLDEFQWTLNTRGLVDIEALGKINLADSNLPFDLSVTHQKIELENSLPVSILSGSLALAGNKLGATAKYKVNGATPESEPVALMVSSSEINFPRASGQADLPIDAQLLWELIHPVLEQGPLKGKLVLGGQPENLNIAQATEAPYLSELQAEIKGLREEPHVDMKLTFNDIEVSRKEGAAVVLDSGGVSFIGTPTAGKADLTFAFDQVSIGKGSMTLSGELHDKKFDIKAARVKLLEGIADAVGHVDWAGVPKFTLSVDGQHFDPQRFIGGEQSDINFVLDAAGEMKKESPAFSLNLRTLTGQWRSYDLAGVGRFTLAGGTLQVNEASLSLGENSLTLDMTVGDRLSGEYAISAPDLSALVDQLSGSLQGVGEITGEQLAPLMVGEISGKNLSYEQTAIKVLAGNYRVSTSAKQTSQLSLNLNGFSLDEAFSGDVALNATGLASLHTATLTAQSPEISGAISFGGSVTGEKWRGRMESFHVSSQALSRWSLEEPVDLLVSKLGELETKQAICLADEEKFARACLTASRAATDKSGGNQITLNGDIIKLPISLINPWLPRGTTATGDLNAKFNAGVNDGRIAADGSYKILNGVLRSDEMDRETVSIKRFGGTFATAGEQVTLEVGAEIDQWFDLKIDGTLPVTENLPLNLNVGIAAKDISWLEDFVPDLAGSTGQIALDGIITGTRIAPRLNAVGKFDGGELMFPEAGLSLNQIDLNVDNDVSDKLLFNAVISSVEKEIKISGNFAPGQEDLPYELNVEGSQFPLARHSELELDISPSLKVNGNKNYHRVTGKLDVPYFNYTLTEIPKSATKISKDQILLSSSGEEQELVEEKMPDWFIDRLAMDVDVTLGEKVTAEGLGLFAQLNGSLKLSKALSYDLNGEGTVIISEGHFDAYGQELSVSKGRVRFAGPLSNPSLKIRALRGNIPVTAGIDISGTVRAPTFEVFSEPPLPASEALAYVVTGRALGDGSQSDGALISQAALGFGLEQSSVITNKVRDLFALDELGVQTGNTIDETALVAGKQLTPKVSVRSEMNIFDQLWSFYLRYKLTEKWSIEAESGVQQGADIIYQVEHESLKGFLPFQQ